MTSNTSTVGAAARELERQLPPERVLAGTEYDNARRIWNGAVDNVPALIVRPRSTNEVQTAVCAAAQHGLPLSVRGGGHDWAGRSMRHGGLVIDLSAMIRVVIDPQTQTATLQGGATAGDVITAAKAFGLAAVTGTVGGVGMAGLTMGGGYGPLAGRYGLALDNLLGAEVVLADGRCIAATRSQEPELYWALRGGGGNFGVVTSLKVRLHPVPVVLTGLIVYRWSDAELVWARLADAMAAAPEELTVQTAVLPGPDGNPALVVSPVWCGDDLAGFTAIKPLQTLATALTAQVAATSYADMLGRFDAHVVTGRHYAMRTRSVPAYTPAVISALVDAGQHRTSKFSAVSVHHFHGAATRVPLEATAFGIRQPHLMVEMLAAWEPGYDSSQHLAWADDVATALGPHALPGGYPNLLGPNDAEQIAHAYGANTARLRAAKSHYDPNGVFAAIPLPG